MRSFLSGLVVFLCVFLVSPVAAFHLLLPRSPPPVNPHPVTTTTATTSRNYYYYYCSTVVVVALQASAAGEGDANSSINISKDTMSSSTFSSAIKVLKGSSDSVAPPPPEKNCKIENVILTLPIEYAGSISLADCGPLVLINGLTDEAAKASGLQELDTITKIAAKDFAGEVLFGDVAGSDFATVVQVYTKAIDYARGNGFTSVELGVSRLVVSSIEEVEDEELEEEYEP